MTTVRGREDRVAGAARLPLTSSPNKSDHPPPPRAGSSYYRSESNFFVYGGGGLKNDFEGHDNWWRDNVIAFTSGALLHNGYGGQVGQPGKGYLEGHQDMFTGNTAIVAYEGACISGSWVHRPGSCPAPLILRSWMHWGGPSPASITVRLRVHCLPPSPSHPSPHPPGSYAKPICTGSPGATVMNTSRVFSPKGQLTTDCGATFDTGAVYAAYTATMAADMIGFARAAIMPN